ncbi:hypothetical protein [Mesorhizobium sp. M0030]|uniref:hypothetical protein n=1 Tax=Mesorhizobium sp. M0030 TaxID=2956851 RepID=UPI003339345E
MSTVKSQMIREEISKFFSTGIGRVLLFLFIVLSVNTMLLGLLAEDDFVKIRGELAP